MATSPQFASAREWLSARLCRRLELLALETVAGEALIPSRTSVTSPFNIMFFLLEAIRDVGPVPGVVERLGKLASGPSADAFYCDSEGEGEEQDVND